MIGRSGTLFVINLHRPGEPLAQKKKGLHRWRPNNSVVGDEGCPRAAGAARFRFGPAALACCAGKRFAFPQLRTLAGSNPMRWAQTKNGPLARTVSNSVVGDEGCRVRLTPPAFASSLRSSRAALENASRFLSSAPWRVRIPLRWAQKRKAPIAGSLTIQWWAMRDSNPQPCACKAPALTVAPIARAERV
jgi:hypothetical protein